MKETKGYRPFAVMAAGTLALVLAFAAGSAAVRASEIGGTLTTTGSAAAGASTATSSTATTTSAPATSSDQTTGSLVASVSSQATTTAPATLVATVSTASADQAVPVATSGGHEHPQTAATGSVQSDGSLAQSTDYTGVGGGYDPALDAYLSSIQQKSASDNAALAPSDAVAYNAGSHIVPFQTNDTAGAAGAQSTTNRILIAVVIGLAVLGLGGYAISAYYSSRTEI